MFDIKYYSEAAFTNFSQIAALPSFLLLAVSSTCTDIPYKFLNTSKLVRTLSVVSVVVATPMLNRQVRSSILADSRSAIRDRLRDGGPSSVWRSVRPVVAGKKDGAAQPADVDVDALNRYFVGLGPRTVAEVDRSGPDLPVRLPRVSTAAFALRTISLGELRRVLSRIRNSSSAGVDGLCIRFVKMCFTTIGSSLLRIVNSSLRTGTVPDSWKLSIIHPVPKAGSSSDLTNFRPISIVPTIAKIVERVVQEQLYVYFNDNHLFNVNQHGFRAQHSTETALLCLTDKVHHAMDSGHLSLLVMLDLSKCFDVVDHARLLEKLQLYGVRTRWFESYLSNHRQQVALSSRAAGRRLSHALPNPLGTYQGSALGPLLYSIYSNDMPLYVDEADIIQYADDTQVLVTGLKQEMSENVLKMERSLAALSLWFRKNALADPAVGFGGGQLGDVTQARVPPKLKTPRIWPTIFGGVVQKHVQK